jgi:hypothetical protein
MAKPPPAATTTIPSQPLDAVHHHRLDRRNRSLSVELDAGAPTGVVIAVRIGLTAVETAVNRKIQQITAVQWVQ